MNTLRNALPNTHCAERQSISFAIPTANPLKRALSYLAKRRNRRLDRAAMRDLLSMDDATLKDIGVSRGDVYWASQLPLSASATTELEIVARRNQSTHRR